MKNSIFTYRYCSLSCVVCLFILFGNTGSAAQEIEMGMGFFAPNVVEKEPLYFFDTPGSNKILERIRPVDSLTYKKVGDNTLIDYAREWFQPIHRKLDYGFFYIRVKRIGREYHELIASETTGKTVYVRVEDGIYSSWPEFLINIFSVEFLEEIQKVYNNPMVKSAGSVYPTPMFRGLYIMGDWMKVQILDDDFNATGMGWIRWKKNGKLLITYNLLR